MGKKTGLLIAFLIGALFGGAMKSAQAAVGDLTGVVRQLERIAEAVTDIKRDGLKCHE